MSPQGTSEQVEAINTNYCSKKILHTDNQRKSKGRLDSHIQRSFPLYSEGQERREGNSCVESFTSKCFIWSEHIWYIFLFQASQTQSSPETTKRKWNYSKCSQTSQRKTLITQIISRNPLSGSALISILLHNKSCNTMPQ